MTAPLEYGPRGRPRVRSLAGGSLIVLVVTGMVGFLLVGQLRGTERFRQRLQAEDEGDLTRILASLSTEADSLRDEVSALRLQLLRLETSSEREQTAGQATDQQLRSLQVLAGTVPVSGPGVVLSITDPENEVTFDTFIDIVQELRDAGAEAVAIDDLRVGVRSAFTERGRGVALDGTALSAPYRVTAIGQASTLDGGLKIPGGAIDTLTALRGVAAKVERSTQVSIPALAKPPTLKVARPVGSAS